MLRRGLSLIMVVEVGAQCSLKKGLKRMTEEDFNDEYLARKLDIHDAHECDRWKDFHSAIGATSVDLDFWNSEPGTYYSSPWGSPMLAINK
tara:strand:- start:80 stop:352 length:273 start_codon:yes stop_codon:yes gene_type:complete